MLKEFTSVILLCSVFSADHSDDSWLAGERLVAEISTQVLAYFQTHAVWAHSCIQDQVKVKLQ